MRIFTDIFQKAMKKVLLLLFFVSGCATLLSAQKTFYIDITGISVSTVNTPKIGDTATITIYLQNDGSILNGVYHKDSFPGGTYFFNYNAGVGSVSENKIDFSHPIIIDGMKYKGTQTVQDNFILTEAFFKKGTNNIVIIWPSGGKALSGNDTLDTIPKATYQFYISDASSGIIPQSTQNSFKIYPNPAKDVVNIQMKETGSGMIRLMDMTGKLIISMPYSAKAGENVSLPLNEGTPIPDGLYLISIETANSSQVSKIMICR